MIPALGLFDTTRVQTSLVSEVSLECRPARVWQRWLNTRAGERQPFYTAIAEDIVLPESHAGRVRVPARKAMLFSMPWPGGYVVWSFIPRNAPHGGLVVASAPRFSVPALRRSLAIPTTETLQFRTDEAGGMPFVRVLHTSLMAGGPTFALHYVMWRPDDFGSRRPDVEVHWPWL
jgi:hypothetical protein